MSNGEGGVGVIIHVFCIKTNLNPTLGLEGERWILSIVFILSHLIFPFSSVAGTRLDRGVSNLVSQVTGVPGYSCIKPCIPGHRGIWIYLY